MNDSKHVKLATVQNASLLREAVEAPEEDSKGIASAKDDDQKNGNSAILALLHQLVESG